MSSGVSVLVSVVDVPLAMSFCIFFVIAGALIIASRHPLWPHPQVGPLGVTMMWPISPVLFAEPWSSLPSIITWLPTPSAMLR